MVGAESGPTAVTRKRALWRLPSSSVMSQRGVCLVAVRGGHPAAELDVAAQVELVGDDS